MITYRTDAEIDLDEFIDVYVDSTLGERRPADDRERMRVMLEEADLVVSAWDGDRLVGLSRSISDWVYCTYLSDLAVRLDYQHQGVGRDLVRFTQEAAPSAMLILLAAPKAVDFYPKIGMKRHDSAWILMPGDVII